MKKKILPLQTLKRINDKYPNAWELVEEARENKNWPDWCYVPVGVGLGISRMSERNVFRAVEDGNLIAALAPWRLSKEIYVFDEELANDLYEQPLDKLPTIVFDRLPFPSIYIEAPGLEAFKGFFVSREFDPKRGDIELRLNFLRSSCEVGPCYISYDSAQTVEEAADRLSLGGRNTKMVGLLKRSLQLVLYLCTSNPEATPRQSHVKHPTVRPKDSYDEIRTWDVGVRYGAAIKQYKRTNRTHAGSHTGKRPHYRRGHFQHYWRGPRNGKRTLEFIWIDPILVNADKADGELPAVIHEVKE